MARTVYDFQSPNRKTAIGKRREAVSGENMQFDDAMLESELDAMIRTHPRERHDRTAGPGDPPAHARRGRLPGRERRVDARMRRNPLRHCERVADQPLPGHAPARWQPHGSELIIAPWTTMIQNAQPFGHYRYHCA